MKTIFSTADVRPRDRFDSWHAAAQQYIIDHDSRPDCRLTFEAKLCSVALDEMTLVSLESSPMTVSHTSRHVAQATPDELFICRQLAGALLLEQDAREVALKAGDMTMLDPRLPYGGRFSSGSSLLVVKVPRRRLEARVGRTGNMIARVMTPTRGENGLISDFLALLPAHAEHLGLTAATVADQALDLLAVAFAKASGVPGPRVSSARFVVLTRLRSAIEGRLTDPALDSAAAAASAGVSVRYANAVLADENTSIARLIQTRRLERCRQALSDCTQRHRSISDIAYRWGFSDMTHFARRFRAAYGLLPREYRKAHSLGSDTFNVGNGDELASLP
ncbi:MAG: AraC family transcriptional regulator [Gammaproteobacteria bacterium]|jgi:AraC family transcriptional activator of tynA and feaB|nr:AraC family transcriptional regulator [Gammaproteobacteria bacterium]